MNLCRKVSLACLLLIGSIAVVVGIITLTVIDGIVNGKVLSSDYIGYEDFNGSKRLNSMTLKWIRPQYSMQQQIWLFDLVNEAEVIRGAKPKVQQIGPYTFMEHQWKSPYWFNKNFTSISYRNNHVYFYNSSLSCAECSLSRRIVIPNVVFQKLVDFAMQGTKQKMLVTLALTVLKAESPFINVTVEEALFKGYHDPLIDLICKSVVFKNLCNVVKIPEAIGFFYGQNETDDGLYEVSTGFTDAFRIGKVLTYNNMTIMPDSKWDSTDAGEIRGTDGQLFPPFLKENQDLEIFAGSICRQMISVVTFVSMTEYLPLFLRTVTMQFMRKSEFRNVAAFRYGFPSNIYDPSVAENRGFCNRNNTPTFFNSSIQIPGCLPKGFLDIGRCLNGKPRIYLSNAHFLYTDPQVQFSVDGMGMPNEKNDDTFVEIEPLTGVPINSRRITQLNVGMFKGNLKITSNMRNIIMPVLWMNESIWFDNDTQAQLEHLISAKRIVLVIGVSVLSMGLLILFAVISVLVVIKVMKHRSNDEQQLLEDSMVEGVEDA
ncbi:CD36 family protein [Dictyocaulus viviparus]|uniref:CD36 family protein n=1 Tax=Dictyocaulus viviparus TaxID=29172 RepID=A0A0D8Y3A6_DICVI|nr:CD36 family protein [Dictyocaulus viviparus]